MPYYFPEIRREPVSVGGGVSSLADFFTTLIDEGYRKDKVKQYDKAVGLIKTYGDAKKQYHDYLVTMANINNAGVGELPQTTQPPPTEQPVESVGEVNPATGQPIAPPISNKPATVTSERISIKPSPVEDKSKALLEKIYRQVGSLNTKGQVGQDLSKDLLSMLAQTEEQNKNSYYVQNGYQVSLTQPGETVKIQEGYEKPRYQEYANSAPYPDKDGNWKQKVYFRNINRKDDTYTTEIDSADPMATEEWKLANGFYKTSNGSYRKSGTGGIPELSQDELSVNQWAGDAVVLANESAKLEQDLQKLDPKSEEYQKKRQALDENRNRETNLANQLGMMTGLESKWVQYRKSQQEYRPADTIAEGKALSTIRGLMWDADKGVTVGQYMDMIASGQNINADNIRQFISQMTNIIGASGLDEEMKKTMYQYLTEVDTGGFMWKMQQKNSTKPEDIQKDLEDTQRKYNTNLNGNKN